MARVCEIRIGNVNNVIEVNGRLFIEGQECTPENLAPIALSYGPTAYPYGDNNINTAGLSQLAMEKTLTRGGSELRPNDGSCGQFNTTRLATGHVTVGPWVFSDTTNLYYGPAASDNEGDYSSFDTNLSLTAASSHNLYNSLTTTTVDGYSGTGSFFLPAINARWLGVGVTASTRPGSTPSDNRAKIAVLQKSGVDTAIKQITHRMPYLVYVDDSWVVCVEMPFNTSGAPSNTYTKTVVTVFNREDGTETTLSDPWISPATERGTEWQSLVGCSPSNIVEGDAGEMDFYLPAFSSSDLLILRGHLYDFNTDTPRVAPSHPSHTVTFDAAEDEMICATQDIPNHSRVFIRTSSGMPGGLTAYDWYWTTRISATQSKLSTSLAAAQANSFVDITSAGSGTLTVYIPSYLRKHGGEAGEPADTSAVVAVPYWNDGGSQRQVSSWTFSHEGVNYLSVGVMEPSNTTTVEAGTDIYTWVLNTNETATYHGTSETSLDGRVRDFMLLDSNRKRLLVVYDNRLVYYTFNPANGWVKQNAINISAREVGVDSMGRIWVTDSGGTYQTGGQSIHIYEPSGAATTISVAFQSDTFSFTGDPIESSIICNAYDLAGDRVEADITLTRLSTNFQFAGAAASVTITTDTEDDTSVPIDVIGTGLLRCRAVAVDS